MHALPTLTALRYIQPLREGGSLPAIVDTDDGLYVVKFRGAGQGPKALIAEIVVGSMARALGLDAPDLAAVDLLPSFGTGEPDPEIQDLLRASHGINVGLRYLDGAFNFALAAAGDLVTPEVAARIVWLDAFVLNPDRSHRNTNLLVHDRRVWLIDHGAALYVHHDWPSATPERARAPFPLVKDHVLLTHAQDLEAADVDCTARLPRAVLEDIMRRVPDGLLADRLLRGEFGSPDDARHRYVEFLAARLEAPRHFVTAAAEARVVALAQPPVPVRARR
ncbi:MAG TPA: HipA family kinase [Longimicrobiales bacterium]|nr:HipA family kinase [Longimicrobiales bacterium]